MNPFSSNLQKHARSGTVPSPAKGEWEIPEKFSTGWEEVEQAPAEFWREACRRIEKRINREAPQIFGKYSLWFAPMPIQGVFRKQNEIRLLFDCTNARRKEEVEKLQPLIERFLIEELYPGCKVGIELWGDMDASQSTRNPAPAPAADKKISKDTNNEQYPPPNLPTESRADEPANLRENGFNAPVFNTAPIHADIDREQLDFYRQRTGVSISDQDLQSVLAAIHSADPAAMRALEEERQGNAKPNSFPTPSRLDEILLEPSYATAYDEIIRSHSAIYLPAYFVRHLRHMGASDGLRFMALRQIAYKQGFKDVSGSHMLPATVKELCRWSTLQPRRIFGGLVEPSSYLYLLAGKVPYLDYYNTRPTSTRWEDANGYHWKANGREYCVWKNGGSPSNECSQLMIDHATGEPQWRQAPLVYRVQLSMPLCPEDEEALRSALVAFGVRNDPLAAIQQCLALPRSEIIPDRPRKLDTRPNKLYTVQELVMETWGKLEDRTLAAKVAVQSKLLETYLIQAEKELLKIPFYLLEKWGRYLSPAQLWTAIIAMDRVYASSKDGEYRDTTTLRNGIKEMMLWTEEEYSKGASRKVSKWLYPFNISTSSTVENDETGSGEHFNPWFSVFASEVFPENGTRTKNGDNSVQLKLRVLPLVPLSPDDTLRFARHMGLTRMAVRDAVGQMVGLEITEEGLAVYLSDGRTLRFSYEGNLQYGESSPVTLHAQSKQLNGIEILTSEQFYNSAEWSKALFGMLENGSSVLSGRLENQPGALFGRLANSSGALFGKLVLEPGALFGILLKLLILNLYGIKYNSIPEQPPSTDNLSDNVDSLERFGSRQGQFIQWTEEFTDNAWDFTRVAKGLGITDIQSLRQARVAVETLVSTVLELYTTPAEKFTSSRIAVLVAKLRADPHTEPGPFLRLAELGPDQLQSFFRRTILELSPTAIDPDWDRTLGRVRRDDLIELVEKLGLARVLRAVEVMV